jgi:hypothetical protein
MSTDNSDDEILDRLNDEASVLPIRPAPAQPSVAPASETSPPGPASTRLASLRRDVLLVTAGIVGTVGLMAALILASAWFERGPAPPASVDGVKLGKSFVQPLAGALADGFDAHADAMEAGKTTGEADETLKSTFAKARAKAFADQSAPFAALVPAGSEPKDDETRRAFIRLHRDFAKGLRSR